MANEEILKKLRVPFKENEISKKPIPTRTQTEELKSNYKYGIRCDACGGWHHKDAAHLDYVGHAALTSRFLEVDPLWNWEPFSIGQDGLPQFDKDGGLWIRLIIGGMSRIGYGNAEPKSTKGDREKEVIGDALRNAAMRFGCALDLWHKGDLHQDKEPTGDGKKPEQQDDSKQLNKSTSDIDMISVNQFKKELDAIENSPNIQVEYNKIASSLLQSKNEYSAGTYKAIGNMLLEFKTKHKLESIK